MASKRVVKLNRQFIRMRLAQLDESVRSISERSSLGIATWYRIMNEDEWNWSAETLAALANDLGCSSVDLIASEDAVSPFVVTAAMA